MHANEQIDLLKPNLLRFKFGTGLTIDLGLPRAPQENLKIGKEAFDHRSAAIVKARD